MSSYHFRFKRCPKVTNFNRGGYMIPMMMKMDAIMDMLSASADRMLRQSGLLRWLPRVNGKFFVYVIFDEEECQVYDVVWRKRYGFTEQNEEICGSERFEVDDKGTSNSLAGWKGFSQLYERIGKAFQRSFDKDDAGNDVEDVSEDSGSEVGLYSERRNIYSFDRLGKLRNPTLVPVPRDEDVFYCSFNDYGLFYWLVEAELHGYAGHRRIGEFEVL